MSVPCRAYFVPAAYAADLFSVAVYCNVLKIPCDEVADLCQVLSEANAAARRLHHGGTCRLGR